MSTTSGASVRNEMTDTGGTNGTGGTSGTGGTNGTDEMPSVGTTDDSGDATEKLVRAVRLLRLGTWTVFGLVVTALLAVTVVGPFLLGNPAVTGGRPALFGGLLLSLAVGTVAFVAAAVLLD